ncbi:hypothetical protein CYLTODRAFT_443154 [Cylindrobasidium torrendii FP15055 ss-10]|uniref:Uncharacterized protein n=1 Tax=Cylindrobasidium torrendii FP15055 ss-10 TaxID=1314674 RepID=A0A0D7BGE0_9AGAR|nr:hypothetical protein CYLTODRAFT_443154 [Cylindrobasidium torrendii FP15055 ss-10]
MTEYDFSPEAQEAYQRRLRGVENWAYKTAQFSPVDPFRTLPSAVGSPTNEFFDTGVRERTGRTKHKSKKHRTEDGADHSRSRSRHHDTGERHHRHRGDRPKHHNRHHRKDGRVYQGQARYGASTHSLAAPEYYGVRHQASAASLAQPQVMMKGGMAYPPLPTMQHKMYAAHPGPMASPMMNVQSPPPPYVYQHPPVRPKFVNRNIQPTAGQPTFVAPFPYFNQPVQTPSPCYGVEQNGAPKKSVVSGFMSKLFGGRKANDSKHERVTGKGMRDVQAQGGARFGKQARRDSF